MIKESCENKSVSFKTQNVLRTDWKKHMQRTMKHCDVKMAEKQGSYCPEEGRIVVSYCNLANLLPPYKPLLSHTCISNVVLML